MTDSFTASDGGPSDLNHCCALNNYRRLFFAHVGALVLTAALVGSSLLAIASIPSWLSVSICLLIAVVAIIFVAAAVRTLRGDQQIGAANRIELLALTLGLSMLQAIFILPVLICIFAPTLRM